MRIALVVHQYPPYRLGGTEVYTRNLALELARRGHEPVVYFRADMDARPFATQEETLEGIRTHRVSAPLIGWRAHPLLEFYRTFRNPAIERDFVNFLHQEKPDIVHFQHVMGLSACLLQLAQELGYPTLLTLHDYWFICANSQLIWPDARICRGKAAGLNCARCALARIKLPFVGLARPLLAPLFWYRDAFVRRAALTALRFIGPSHFILEQYQKAGFPPDRCVYLENGVNVTALQAHPHVPSPDGRLRFTYLGSLAWQKGVHVLVEAFRDVPVARAILKIYGNPQVFPDYVSQLRKLANPENTLFMGAIPNSEVGQVLSETDVLVVPSLWYENSPVVIQEAFASHTPVLASRIGALVEKVGNSDAGLLFPPGDVEALRATIMELINGAYRINKFPEIQSIEYNASRIEALYLSVRNAFTNFR